MVKASVLAGGESAASSVSVFQLTNPDLRLADQGLIPKETLGIKWERTIESAQRSLHDLLTFENFGLQRVEVPLSLTFRAGFEDVFVVRGFATAQRGRHHEPAWQDNTLRFVYDGKDGLRRCLSIGFTPSPARDLRLLQSDHGAEHYFAAGVPWYVALRAAFKTSSRRVVLPSSRVLKGVLSL